MSINGGLTPGGDSNFHALARLARQIKAAMQRVERGATKGLTKTPVDMRGILAQDSAGQLYFDFNGAVIKDIKGLGAASGLAVVFEDQYANFAAAVAAVDKPGIVIYNNRMFYIVSALKIEQAALHCIMNGSFEHWTGDNPDFWTKSS